MIPSYPERIHLAHLPTPIDKLDRLSEFLGGPELFIKRDDQTGLALGGNKVRKLEFLAADALAQGCDHLVTSGAPQSNHCRQTAAVAARLGLGCTLVLQGNQPAEVDGNILLDLLLGARLFWSGDRPSAELVNELSAELAMATRRPYTIPRGGSNVVGATGYVWAMHELIQQLDQLELNFDLIVVASSSGGTQAGLALGAKVYGFHGRILGISIDSAADALKQEVSTLATATAIHLGLGAVDVSAFIEANDDYLGEGYGIVSESDREAIRLMALYGGILLDPVYTGRAMGGLIDLIRRGEIAKGQRVLFWHTGGTPALFPYSQDLL